MASSVVDAPNGDLVENELLKKAFCKAQTSIVYAVNAASAIDFLFGKGVISDDDVSKLLLIENGRDQCRKLLSLLHSAQHPRAFVELRLSLRNEAAYYFVVDEIDRHYNEVATQSRSAESQQGSRRGDPPTIDIGFKKLPANEQPSKKSSPVRDLSRKLTHLLCMGDTEVKCDVYPILVSSRVDASISREKLKQSFKFIDAVPWKAVFDFDNAENENSLYRYMDEDMGKMNLVTSVEKFDSRAKEFREEKKLMQEAVKNGSQTIWFFVNGHHVSRKEALGLKDWKRQYSEGLNEALRFLAQEVIPQGRALVVFLLLSSDDEIMAAASELFYLKFEDSWLAIAEEERTASMWKTKLLNVSDENELKRKCVLGMPWEHVNETIIGLYDDGCAGICQLNTSTGALVSLSTKTKNSWNDLHILGCNECANADIVKNYSRSDDLEKFKSNVEQLFYRGHQVDWWNFYFSTQVLSRDLFRRLYDRVKIVLEQQDVSEDQLLTIVRLCHQPSAGGTTIAKQILWEFKDKCRCAVVKKLSDLVYDQIVALRAYKDKDNPLPVLLLLDNNYSDDIVSDFAARLTDKARKSCKTTDAKFGIFFVLLVCQSNAQPKHCIDDENHFVLKAALSDRERIWVEDKYKTLEDEFKKTNCNNPQNFISFNVMKANFKKDYMKEVVRQYTQIITSPQERKLLKYVSLISKFDSKRQPIPVSSFDSLMNKQRWETCISEPLKVLLHETGSCRSRRSGEDMKVRIINSALSEYIYEDLTISVTKKETEAEVLLEFLNSEIFDSVNAAVDKLLEILRYLMKNREKKVVNGKIYEEQFSPLIKAIKDDKNQHVPCAVQVLNRLFDITNDLFIGQQIARLYINVHNWEEALKYGKMITEREENSYLLDTLAQVYKAQLKVELKKKNSQSHGTKGLVTAKSAGTVLDLAFLAIDTFQRGQKAAERESVPVGKNFSGHFGEIKTALHLVNFLALVEGLQDQNVLQQFLIENNFVPDCVKCWKPDWRDRIKKLESSVMKAIYWLEDEYVQLQPKANCSTEYAVLKYRHDRDDLLDHKEQIVTYFCVASEEVPPRYNPQEASEFYRRKVRNLGGDTLRGLLDIRNEAKDRRQRLLKILETVTKNIDTVYQTSYDLKVFLGASLMYCSLVPACKYNCTHEQMAHLSSVLYQKIDVHVGTELEPYLFAVMFNWPRKTMNFLPAIKAHCMTDILRFWRLAFNRRHPRKEDEQKKETTYFFLAQGVEMEAFAYSGEFDDSRRGQESSNTFWSDAKVTDRLERLVGTLVRRHSLSFVSITLQQEGNEYPIEIPTSLPQRDIRMFNKQVSFYIGFQWSGPKAFGLVLDDELFDDEVPNAESHPTFNTEIDFPKLPSSLTPAIMFQTSGRPAVAKECFKSERKTDEKMLPSSCVQTVGNNLQSNCLALDSESHQDDSGPMYPCTVVNTESSSLSDTTAATRKPESSESASGSRVSSASINVGHSASTAPGRRKKKRKNKKKPSLLSVEV